MKQIILQPTIIILKGRYLGSKLYVMKFIAKFKYFILNFYLFTLKQNIFFFNIDIEYKKNNIIFSPLFQKFHEFILIIIIITNFFNLNFCLR